MLVLIIFGIFAIGILAENSGNIPSEVCNLKAKTGPCRALDPRYYYNSQEKACQKFNYGGCAGNKNNFKTEEECINFCIKSVTPSSSDIRYQIPAPSFIQKTTTPSVPETLQKPSDTIANKPGDTTNSKPNDTNYKPIETNYKPIDTNSKPNDTIDSQPKDTTDSKPNETIYNQPKDTLPKPDETNSKP